MPGYYNAIPRGRHPLTMITNHDHDPLTKLPLPRLSPHSPNPQKYYRVLSGMFHVCSGYSTLPFACTRLLDNGRAQKYSRDEGGDLTQPRCAAVQLGGTGRTILGYPSGDHRPGNQCIQTRLDKRWTRMLFVPRPIVVTDIKTQRGNNVSPF
jgi:hypothetical protein